MTRLTAFTAARRSVLGLAALPLALALAACGDKAADGAPAASPTGEPIAAIAPPAGKAWADMIAKTADGGYRMGNPDAPIKLVEYGALSCSHCAEFAKEGFPKLRDQYVASGRVSVELRYFLLNALDIPAVLLATCGSDEAVIPLSEQFWAWQPTMFEKLQANDAAMKQISSLQPAQQIPAVAQAAGMTEFFSSRGIAADQAKACLADTKKAQALTDQTQKATDSFGVTGTPTFIINGSNVGSMTWAELEARLQQAGAR